MTALTLTDFLRARLGEEQQSALAQWSTGPSRHLRGSVPPSRYATPEVAEADVDAKRRIVDLHEAVDDGIRERGRVDEAGAIVPCRCWYCGTCDYDRDYGYVGGPEEGCETLRLLALPYADHPDYDESWRP